MPIYIGTPPRSPRIEDFLLCRGCLHWVPKPWEGWVPQCESCGVLHEATGYVHYEDGICRAVRGWYPEGTRPTPPHSALAASETAPRLIHGVHYRDVKVQQAPAPPAPPVSRIKPFAPTVLAFVAFALALLAYTFTVAR